MTECTHISEAMRDRLPLLAHDALGANEAARVRAHLVACPACAAELGLLQASARLFAAATPAVNTDAIVSMLPAPPALAPLRLVPTTKRGLWMPRRYLAAAASLLLVGTISLAVLDQVYFGQTSSSNGVDSSAVGVATALTVPVALLGASDLAGLGTDELTMLLAELDAMEATVAAEPITMRQPLVASPEEL